MFAANFGAVDMVARLLQELRVRAIVDVQDSKGDTALHWAYNTDEDDEKTVTAIVRFLLQAGANPALKNTHGEMA